MACVWPAQQVCKYIPVDTNMMKMRVAVLILAAIQFSGTALNISETESLEWVLFESFMTNHSKIYTDKRELGYRFQVFQVSFTESGMTL